MEALVLVFDIAVFLLVVSWAISNNDKKSRKNSWSDFFNFE